jgi:putative phage-type endonuclease
MITDQEIIDEILESSANIHPKRKIEYTDYLILVNNIYKELIKKTKKITHDYIGIILSRQYKINISFDSDLSDYKCLRNYLSDKIKIPSKYKKLESHFRKLESIPQPEQKTQEWFDYRKGRITASDTAEAIDLNPYDPVESFILKKCDPEHKFLDNENVYHGKKYEQIATLLYEHIYNTVVTEFGALPSENHPILGASPDGICSPRTLDNKFSELLGRMLEIKCTVRRTIYTSGKICGHICPFYYYCQVQQQLECCDLEKCDFWQCKIIEYDRCSYLTDSTLNDTKHTFGTNSEKIEINNLYKKGVILKFLPKNFIPEFEGDDINWKSKFIYPPRLDMNEFEYDQWIINMINNWMVIHKEIAQTHYYEKVVYWKIIETHNVTIDRDRKFFNNILPILKDTWGRVEYYRNNLDKLSELKLIIEKRKKYKKINTSFKINNDITNQKILFLENNNTEDECDFID